MKSSFKIILLSIGILFLSLSVSYATNETDPLSSESSYQIQQTQTSLDGLIYLLFVQGPASLYTPTFEFEAGNSLIVTGASHKYGVLQGIWQEAPLGQISYFQAQVEESETATTTTITIPTPTNLMSDSFETTEQTKFLIDLWGISFSSLPPPFSNLSMLIGAGAYLGANVVFAGFSGRTEEAQCSSIDPTSGKQGETNIQIDLVGLNTNFVEGKTEVTFSGEGISVSGVTVLNTTKISFNIAIDEFALEGIRDVIVTVTDPPQTVVCSQAFTVEPAL